MRACAMCKQQFTPKVYVGRDYSYCKPCVSIRRKTQWASNKDHIARLNRKSRLKKEYGLSIEEYELLLKQQFGECAICRSKTGTRKTKTRTLAVDHDHKTGKVRGLLCQPCNTVLGMFNDNPTLFKRAIKYLEASKS